MRLFIQNLPGCRGCMRLKLEPHRRSLLRLVCPRNTKLGARFSARPNAHNADVDEVSTSGRDDSLGPNSVPARTPPENVPFASTARILYKKVLRELSSLPRAIGLMVAIAALSGLGTFIEQNKGLEFYVESYPDGPEKVLGFLTWKWIVTLELDHLYTSWYFLGLIAVLAASLAACTKTRQWPVAKVAQRWRFAKRREALTAVGAADVLPNARLSDLALLLKEKGYQVFVREKSLYAFQGMAGRWAPIGVHAALLLVLFGTAWSGLGGWKGTVMCPEGKEFLVRDALYPASPLAITPEGVKVAIHVNTFEVDYRPDGSPAQFYSDLSVLDPGSQAELAHQRISVNVPLRYGGVTMYQTDWALSQVNVRVGAPAADEASLTSIELPMASLEGQPGISGKLWASFLPVVRPEDTSEVPPGISFLARDLQSVALYDSKGQFVGVRRPGSGKPIEVDGLQLVLDRVLGSTGMEIKADPGVPIVYAGFGGTMITVVLCYISHSQVWALQEEESVLVTGKTNRALVAFNQELSDILDRVPEVLPGTAAKQATVARAQRVQ